MPENRLLRSTDLIYIFMASIILLIALSADIIWNKFVDSLEGGRRFYEELNTIADENIDFILDTLFTPTLTTAIVWAIFGMLCYFFVSYFVNRTKNTVDELNFLTKYIHPKGFSNSHYVLGAVKHTLVSIVIVGCLLMWLILSIKYFFPLSGYSASIFINESIGGVIMAAYLLLGVVSIFTALLGFVVLVRLFGLIHGRLV